MIGNIPNPKHELWARWRMIRNVCTNENSPYYKYYGGRGIKYPKRWTSFERFVEDIESTIGPVPFDGAMLDRINNDGSYSLRNIKWSTPQENANNRRSNHMITYKGETKSMAEWSRETGIPMRTLWSRVVDRGMTPSEAFTVKPYQRKRT